MTRRLRPLADLHDLAGRRVHSAMSAAMRADPAALDAGAARLDIDVHSRGFVREARGLVLACGAALMSSLAIHRPGLDVRGRAICRACGTAPCHTLGGIANALAAYAVRPVGIDRAEAWRRADAAFGSGTVALAIEECPDCYIARPVTSGNGEDRRLLAVDRRTGAVTRWPDMPSDRLAERYRSYLRGDK